jgi:hypothetical protein
MSVDLPEQTSKPGKPSLTPWSPTWLSMASPSFGLLLVSLVLVLFAPVRTAGSDPVPSATDTPLTAAVAAALSTPDPELPVTPGRASPVSSLPTAGSPSLTAPAETLGVQAVIALTARLIDGRARAAFPQTLDLGAIRAASIGSQDPALRTASMFGEQPTATGTTDESVTGAAVAFGAPDVGRRGGIGPATFSTSGPGGTASAMISGLSELPVRAGFTVARDSSRTGTIHASIQPLDRPG